MRQAAVHPCVGLFQEQIRRFREHAVRRSTCDRRAMRRKHRRYHRSWPLTIATCQEGCVQEYSAALHDASEGGIGFMCDRPFEIGSLIYIQLFWHDISALRIPAIVRHITHAPGGVLVGTEFALSDVDACEVALRMDLSGPG